MKPLSVTFIALNRMPKSMSKIQMGSHASLLLILHHNSGFNRTTALNGRCQSRYITRLQRTDLSHQPVKKSGVTNQAVLNDLSQSCGIFSIRQSGQGVEIDDDVFGLMKSADQVFAHGVVNPRFTAYRRIHLSQQGRRYLNKVRAT